MRMGKEKNKLKEFFKPTKWKIILFISLIFISYLLGAYYSHSLSSGCLLDVMPIVCPEGTKPFAPPGTCTRECMSNIEIRSDIISSIILEIIFIILLPIISLYFLSCLIIFSYKKIKNNKT